MKASIFRPLLLLAIFGVSATLSSAPQHLDVGVPGPIQHYEATPIQHDKVDPAPVQDSPVAVASSVADQEPVEEFQGEADAAEEDNAPAAANDEEDEEKAPANSFRYKDNPKNREIMREVSRLLNKNRYSDDDDDSNSESEEDRGRRGRRGRGRGIRRRRYRNRYDDDSDESDSDEYGDGYRRSRRRYRNGRRPGRLDAFSSFSNNFMRNVFG